MTEKRLLTVSAIARECRVPEPTVRSLADRGVLHPMRDSSGRRLFNQGDIERLREYRLTRTKR